jgi:acetyl-CoA C-acetyltransferase
VDLTNLDMATTALSGLVKRYELEGAHIDEVVGGAVVTQSADWNFAREVVLGTKLAASTPGATMMQACGTSLQAALDLGAKIAIGEIESGIAMGADTISDAPIVFKRRFAHRLAAVNRAKGMGAKLSALKGFSFGELAPVPPSTSEPRTGLSMGEHAELMAKQWEIPREAQDELAYESHKKAAAAYDEGFMDDLLVPCAGIFRDNNLRADIDLAKMAELKPAFDRSGKGTLTAANSTPLTDGAACMLLASEDWAKARGLPILAYMTMGQTAALDFVAGEGLLMAPTFAVNRLLSRANLKLQEFDYYEIHEAFAAQVLCTLKAFESPEYCRQVLGRDEPLGAIDRAKLNVKGSSIAFGHPFAATGARIMGNLAKLLTQTPKGRGLISVCTAGGMGVVAIFEGVECVSASQRTDEVKEGVEGEARPGEEASAGPSDPASTLP